MLRLAAMLSLALCPGATALAAPPARDPAAIRALAEGKRQDANAAWWGFDPDDATAALQAAIRSGAKTVVVPNVGRPWIVGPIFLVSDQEIDLESGVEIRARAGKFRGASDELFRIDNKSNVVIKGYGAALRMRKQDYRRPPYAKSEFRDCLGIYGGANIKILGLKLASSGGDGIYIAGGGAERPFSRDILIKDVLSEDNYRQGISVISVDGLRVENSIFRGTEGTEPAAGIDFEPNGPTDRLTRIALKDCVFEKNQGWGIQISTTRLPADFPAVEISVEGGRVSGNGQGAFLVYPGQVRGNVSVKTALDGKRRVRATKAFVVDIAS